jgi:hypothetical protein
MKEATKIAIRALLFAAILFALILLAVIWGDAGILTTPQG